jgi:hypothetical protein
MCLCVINGKVGSSISTELVGDNCTEILCICLQCLKYVPHKHMMKD